MTFDDRYGVKLIVRIDGTTANSSPFQGNRLERSIIALIGSIRKVSVVMDKALGSKNVSNGGSFALVLYIGQKINEDTLFFAPSLGFPVLAKLTNPSVP